MSTETITKRFHISGLTTPAITPTDLAKRLGAFGKVISLDGFGKHDALGQPRPFGYATIEGRKADLAKCEIHVIAFLLVLSLMISHRRECTQRDSMERRQATYWGCKT
jgi:hypothetical protein